MRSRKNYIVVSYAFMLAIAGVLASDMAGLFNYSDMPFLIAFVIYGLFVYIQKSSSKVTFSIAIVLLLYMGLSYIPTGSSVVTERFGEWFCLYFAFGLMQYGKEMRAFV